MIERSIKKNTVFNAIKTVSAVLFPLITFPYISRVLMPDNVGKINFGLSIVSYFTLIASLGISTYAIRECSAVRDDRERLSNTASQIFTINVITTIVAYIFLAITLVLYKKLEDYRLLIAIQSLSIITTTLGTDWLNSAIEDFKYITVRTVSFQIIGIVLMFIFVKHPNDFMKYAIICVISSAGANIANMWYRRRYCKVRFIKNIITDIEWKRHFLPIIFLFVMTLAQNIFNNVDSTMLGLMHGDYEVGIYSTAHKIQNIITQVIVSIAWVVMPRMSLFFSEDRFNEANKLIGKVFCFFCTAGLPCIIGVTLLSKDIIYIVAGVEYSESADVLQVLMLSFLFNLFGGSFWGNIVLLPSKRERDFMIICCISAGINVITNIILIPYLGAFGAALTTGLCNLIMLILLVIKKDKLIKVYRIKEILLPPLIGCIAIVLVCVLCYRISFIWIRVPISVIASSCIYLIVQIVGKNELIMNIGRKIIRYLHI